MRTFIAIELSQEIKEYLTSLQNKLKISKADVRWVEPKNIHLTLKFLGEIDENKLGQISVTIEEVAKENNRFTLSLAKLGAFPNEKSPRIIWVGLGNGASEAKHIANLLEEKLDRIGIPKETREFSSHITIGRAKSNLNQMQLVKEMGKLLNIDCGLEFAVKKITLFKSTLTPKGPTYEILKENCLMTT